MITIAFPPPPVQAVFRFFLYQPFNTRHATSSIRTVCQRADVQPARLEKGASCALCLQAVVRASPSPLGQWW